MAVEDEATARGERPPAGEAALFGLLRNDHREIVRLFDQLALCEKGEMETLLTLFNRIEEGLQRHLEGEERFLYTALERHEEARDLVLENYELHRLATSTMGAFKSLALDDQRWRPKLRVLRRLVEAHVESQENELFPMAGRVLGSDQLRAIEGQFVGVRSGSDPHRAGFDAPQ